MKVTKPDTSESCAKCGYYRQIKKCCFYGTPGNINNSKMIAPQSYCPSSYYAYCPKIAATAGFDRTISGWDILLFFAKCSGISIRYNVELNILNTKTSLS